MDAALITIHDSRFTTPRRLTWLFDLDNTLHDASRAALGPTSEAMTDYIASHLAMPHDEAWALRRQWAGFKLRREPASFGLWLSQK